MNEILAALSAKKVLSLYVFCIFLNLESSTTSMERKSVINQLTPLIVSTTYAIFVSKNENNIVRKC